MTELFEGAGRRLRVLIMPSQAIFGFLRGLDGRAAYRMYGMPEDTKCVGVTTSRDGEASVVFLLESKEWEPLGTSDTEIPEVKFEMLTALMPTRLEKPTSMGKPKPAPVLRKLE
jgi:hypothetical protein